MEDIRITAHAYQRLKERNGWNRKTADRMMPRIYEKGTRPDTTKGYIGTWLRSQSTHHERIYPTDKEYVVYGKQIYIFAANTLITVLPEPSKTIRQKFCEDHKPAIEVDEVSVIPFAKIEQPVAAAIIKPVRRVDKIEPAPVEKRRSIKHTAFNPQYSKTIEMMTKAERKTQNKNAAVCIRSYSFYDTIKINGGLIYADLCRCGCLSGSRHCGANCRKT